MDATCLSQYYKDQDAIAAKVVADELAAQVALQQKLEDTELLLQVELNREEETNDGPTIALVIIILLIAIAAAIFLQFRFKYIQKMVVCCKNLKGKFSLQKKKEMELGDFLKQKAEADLEAGKAAEIDNSSSKLMGVVGGDVLSRIDNAEKRHTDKNNILQAFQMSMEEHTIYGITKNKKGKKQSKQKGAEQDHAVRLIDL